MGLLDRVTATLTGVDPIDPDARAEMLEALALADRGELAAAEERLAALAGRLPRAVAVLLALGEVRARRSDDEGAVTAYGRAVDVSVEAIDAWLGLGEALVRLGRADPAHAAFRRVLAAAPDPGRRARAHAGRGRLALAAGRAAKAVRELRKAAELLPEDLAIAADLGRALMATGDPEGWQWLLRAAQHGLSEGSSEGSGEGSTSSHAPAPSPNVSLTLIIEAARASPKRDAALALLRAARARTRGAPARQRAQLAAELARQLAGADRVEEARALGAEALAAAANDPEVLEGWRVVAEAAGDVRGALAAAARAAELGAPVAPSVMVRLALAARDGDALARVAAALPADDVLGAAVRAFSAGTASEEDLLRLGSLARDEAGRRFVASALAPGPPPQGNLFALLEYARDLCARTPELAPLLPAAARAAEAFDRPLLIAVMGEFNAGKSSFVNALCGAEVAPVGVTPTTATVNVLRYGPPGGRVLYHDGRAEDLAPAAVSSFLNRLNGDEAAAVRLVEIFFPLEVLRRVEMVDTPGLNSLRPEHERVARAFLTEADALVWLFAVGQAAKASESDALDMAQQAGKRVLGVLNKADQADPDDLARVADHVRTAIGTRIEALIPLSARDAIRAKRAGDDRLLASSGLPALLAALEERFFGDARALKRQTALAALSRFAREARRQIDQGRLPDQAASEDRAGAPGGGFGSPGKAALEAARVTLEGAVAAERVALRARLEASFRRAASEILEFVRPRSWLLGERRAESADEEFLFDLLDDAVAQGTETSRRALEAAAAPGPPVPIAAVIDRFRAYARGVMAGGLVERFLHEQLPAAGGRIEEVVLQRSLARRVPDVEGELFAPLAAEIDAAHARARAALAEEELRSTMRALVREARIIAPLAALEQAVALVQSGGPAPIT
jgi:tetratricopeptide (TPR) repeat protein